MARAEIDKLLESTPRIHHFKKLVYGVGINDSSHATSVRIGGRSFDHRAYIAWNGMLQRCYSTKLQVRHPTYIGCSVADEWISFSSFKKWWDTNFTEGWQLDKDLLISGNKIYSSNTCVYIPSSLNNFTTGCDSARGHYPIGVSFDKREGKFKSKINDGNGKRISLGHYNDPYTAHEAWYKAKVEQAIGYKWLCDEIHPDLFSGLLAKIKSMRHI